ncbi:MAG: hypothetical protein IK062_08315 [Selenomonadaceae bacterium]|nr:hypothetical protein [Selenomonadaceae bacterium]
MYKKEEKALKLYEEVKSVKKVIQKLGYPTREGLYKWLRDSKNPPPELKLETIRRCFERGEVVHRTILLARVSSVDLRMNFFMVMIGQIISSTTSFNKKIKPCRFNSVGLLFLCKLTINLSPLLTIDYKQITKH